MNELNIDIDNATVLNVNTESINSNTLREDKKVTITDETGRVSRTSTLMFGYNREGIVLNDGTFVTEDKLKEAIQRAITSVNEGEVVVKRTGLRVQEKDVDALISFAKKAAGSIVIGSRNQNVENQDSASWSVLNSEGKKVSKGIAFLGNKGIILESGEYVNLEEVQKSIKDFFGIKVPIEENDSRMGIVRERRKNGYAILPFLAIINIATGLNVTKVEDQTVHINSTLGYQTIGYTETQVQEESTTIINPEYKMGDEVEVEKGDSAYYDALLRDGTQKEMNETGFYAEGKYEGSYKITGFAICDKNGNILLDYEEGFDEEKVGYLLFDLEQKVHNEQGIAYEDMSIRFHLGTNNDHSRLGWIEVNSQDVIPYESVEEITKNVTEIAFFKGIEDNFDGTYITLSNGERLKVIDDEGNLLPNYTDVKSEEGNYYTIRDLELTEETIVDSVETHKKLSYSINYPVLSASVLALVAKFLYDYKKTKEAKNKKPSFNKFKDDAEMDEFIRSFEELGKKYENKSLFGRLKRFILGKNIHVFQQLDETQVKELYNRIISYKGSEFQVNPDDRIEFEGNKVFIIYKDGKRMDITEEAVKLAKDIGVNNPIIAEGMVEDEVHRRY